MSEAAVIPEWDLADRMRKALRVSGRSVQEMADYLGVAPTTVSTWINGRNRPSPASVRLWAMSCDVDFEWLAGGELRRAPIRLSAGINRHSEPCGCMFIQVKGRWWQVVWCPDHHEGLTWEGPPVNLYRSGLGLAA